MPAALEFAAAMDALRAGRTGDAVPLLEAALDRAPEYALAALNLGMALMDLGRLDEAGPPLRRALAGLPHMAEVHFRIGRLAHLRRDLAAARPAYERALLYRVDHVPALAGLAVIERAEGSKVRAEALMGEALLHAPEDSTLALEQAGILLEREAVELALPLIEDVLIREPESGRAGLIWADALIAMHGAADARAFAEKAVACDPLCAARVAGLAKLLEVTDRHGEALVQWHLAEALAPDDGQILSSLGHALWRQRDYKAALGILERAVRLLPNELKLRAALGEQLFRTHRLAEAEDVLRGSMRDLGHDHRACATLALVEVSQGLQEEALATAELTGGENAMVLKLCSLGPYHPELARPEALRAAADVLHEGLLQNLTPYEPQPRLPRDRLRVGFLSSAFGAHPVGWFTLAGIENLPRDAFEVVLISLGERTCALARRFKARADRWVRLDPGIEEPALLEALRAEQLDIVVDLGGHGQGGRVRVLRHRCAPVQIKWVGSQSATSGVPNLDWMLTDRWETPEGYEPFYLERLLRLPDGYVCFEPPRYAPAVSPAPLLSRGHVTFGCFNNMAKITPRVIACWARIMEAMSDSWLVLRTHALGDPRTRDAFVERAIAAGLPPARMELHGAVPHEQLLAAYQDIDISLDPFPYAGGLTVCESLWMGVPVLALVGGSFSARHAFSHLSNIGLADWAEFDEDGYVAQAVARAGDPAALAALRMSLRERMAASPLCDAPRFGRNLGAALERAWQEAPLTA
ncbi:MAG: hypothetical protein JWR10_1813 [Rubritepida sp.]|nr:hypothetical protein [Rubritepida sp.]